MPFLPISLSFADVHPLDDEWQVTLEWFLVSRQAKGSTFEAIRRQRQLIAPLFQFKNSTPEKISKRDIEVYLSNLLEQGKSLYYVKSVFKALRSFFSWCVEEELIQDSPTKKVKPPGTLLPD